MIRSVSCKIFWFWKTKCHEQYVKALEYQLDAARAESNAWAKKLHELQGESLCKAEPDSMSSNRVRDRAAKPQKRVLSAKVDLTTPSRG